ncbi:hypothetical protein [Caulobacter segnis]|jgi:hypothetical protein|uniref:hypothetical protein n=1 Tax=Caulobacter segnis TaxID=88688 RepID=UPI001CBEC6EC|nr:hypothetical protein [Caulobacter segnis]UAL10027.1 hypothetical protein K8940_20025 [Caulobacter segnis]
MYDDQLLDRDPQTALAEFKAGPFSGRAEVRVTPVGILAIGALMTGVLLSTALVVWASTSVGRARASRR